MKIKKIHHSNYQGHLKLPHSYKHWLLRLKCHVNISKCLFIYLWISFQVYCTSNADDDNPYQQLEKCDDFGLLHDATTSFVKEINTVFMQAVANEGGIFKVPFSMKQVPGSFTGEALCKELVKEISSIRPMKNNATVTEQYQSSKASCQRNQHKSISKCMLNYKTLLQ